MYNIYLIQVCIHYILHLYKTRTSKPCSCKKVLLVPNFMSKTTLTFNQACQLAYQYPPRMSKGKSPPWPISRSWSSLMTLSVMWSRPFPLPVSTVRARSTPLLPRPRSWPATSLFGPCAFPVTRSIAFLFKWLRLKQTSTCYIKQNGESICLLTEGVITAS